MKKILVIFTIITLCGCDNNNKKVEKPSLYKFNTRENVSDMVNPVDRLENNEVVCYQQVRAIWCYKK